MASGLLPKLQVSSSLCDEVPHIFIPISHLEPREYLISSAKRLLQQYRTRANIGKVTALHLPRAILLHHFTRDAVGRTTRAEKRSRASPFVAPEILEARWRKFGIAHG